MPAARFFQAVFQEFDVDQFADQRRGDRLRIFIARDLVLDLDADLFGDLAVEFGFLDQRVDDLFPVPADDVVARGPDE